MTDPNLPHDPRFSPPPAAPTPPPVQPPQAQPPHVPQPPQALPPQAPQPPQNPAYQTPQPHVPQAPPVQPPSQPFTQAPPVAPPDFQPPSAVAPPAYADPTQTLLDTSFDGATVHDQAEKKSSIAGRVGLVAAALAVAGGGAFAVTRALAEPAGAETADEAVTQLFEAVENDDLIGLTEAMLPSEREALIDPMIDLFAELERLEILDEDVDLEARTDEAGSGGIDFSVSGLAYTTTVIGEGVVNVQLTGGIVSVTGDVGDLPFGERATAEIGQENMSESLDEEIANFAEEPDAQFTVVEEDGSWYISLWYSVAEAAREEAGEPVPAFGAGVVPVGGDTPEDALRVMMEAAVDLDAEGVVAALDPAEFRALHDYAPLFLDDADEAAAEFRQMLDDEGITYSLDRLDLSSADVRGRTVVSVDGFAVSAFVEGESFSLDYDGNCFTAILGSEIDETCLDGLRDELAGEELPEAYLDLVTESDSGVTVVERDGQWFVSGVPTIIGAYTDLLASLEPQDIEDLTDFFGSSFEDAFELGFEGFEELNGGNGNDPFGEFDEDPFFEEVEIEDAIEEDAGDAIEEAFPEENEDGYDPFADDEGTDNGGFEELEVSVADAALFPADWFLEAVDPEGAYFANSIGIPAVSYTRGYLEDDFGTWIEVERFDVSADVLNAAMADGSLYDLVVVEGLPAGATAYDWEGVDRAIVIDGFIVTTYFDDDGTAMALLTERVNAIVNG